MAISKNNEVVHGLSGKLGDLLVFRRRFGKTVVAKSPNTDKIVATDQQVAVRRKFKKALLYAQSVMANDAMKNLYAAKAGEGISAYNIALADFFKAPEIHDINTNGYSGAVGGIIKVDVTDNFMVKAVSVAITGADNNLIEKGDAIIDADGINWTYVTTVANAVLAGTKIVVTASDLPANLASAEKILV